MTSVKTRRFGSGNEGAMGTVDGKYSSPSPRDPAPQISMLLPSEQEMPQKATSDVALTNNFEIRGWGRDGHLDMGKNIFRLPSIGS